MMFPKSPRIKLSRPKYIKVCKYVIDRDETCRSCESASIDEIHHVVKRSQQGNDSPNNLVGLCAECHMLIEHYELDLPQKVYDMLEGEPLYLE